MEKKNKNSKKTNQSSKPSKKKTTPQKRYTEYRPLKHLRRSLDKGEVLSRL